MSELTARLELIRRGWTPPESMVERSGGAEPPNVVKKPLASEIFDPSELGHGTNEQRNRVARDYALRAVDAQEVWANPKTDVDATRERVDYLVRDADRPTKENPDRELSRRILATGSPAYTSAFSNLLLNGGKTEFLSAEEQRAAALAMSVNGTGGFAVPFGWDPTVIAIGAHTTINPYRKACKVVDLVGSNIWHGLTSTAIAPVRGVEALVAVEAGPTFAQPSYTPSRVQTQITYSIEVGQDRPNIGEEIAVLIQEGKDNEEESSFSVGIGTTTTLGVVGMVPPYGTAGLSYTAAETAAASLTLADLVTFEQTIPVRFRMNAAWFFSRKTIRAIQLLETAYGAVFNGAGYGNPGYPAVGNPKNDAFGNTGLQLLGYPVYESPSIPSTLTAHLTFGAFADPQTYQIVDRVGMDVEFIPFIFGSAQGNMVTGQRAIYAIWRNAAAPLFTTGGLLLDIHS